MVEFYKDSRGFWRWRLKAENHEIIADSAEGYASEYNAKRAWTTVLAVVRNDGGVPIEIIRD